jgi:hypothetical protein
VDVGCNHFQSGTTELTMAFAVAEIRKNHELNGLEFVIPYFVGDGEAMPF